MISRMFFGQSWHCPIKWARYRRFPRLLVSLALVVCWSVAGSANAFDSSKRPPPPPGAPAGWGHYWNALECYKEGNWEKAMNEASYLFRNPQYSNPVYSQKALILHGDCYQRLGRPGEALKAYLVALKKYGKNEEAFVKLGEVYLREENPEAALRAYRGAVRMNDASIPGHSGVAAAYLALGKTPEATAAIARVEELGGDVDELRKQLAAAKN